MTRIIAGFARSHRLRVPSTGTRPTSDRVREAIFSALDARDVLVGARVLDLYAGSGALGLEAASRGASSVILVERNRAAAQVTKANVGIVTRAAVNGRVEGPAPEIAVLVQPVHAFLSDSADEFDVVFIDPPYDLSDTELALNLTALVPRLSGEAVIVLERSTRTAAPAVPAGLALERHKTYGETSLWWLAPTR